MDPKVLEAIKGLKTANERLRRDLGNLEDFVNKLHKINKGKIEANGKAIDAIQKKMKK